MSEEAMSNASSRNSSMSEHSTSSSSEELIFPRVPQNRKMKEVERIMDHRERHDRDEYLVQWKNAKDRSSGQQWTPIDDCDCPTAIFEYWQRIGVRMIQLKIMS